MADWRAKAQKIANGKLNHAAVLIERCEADLKRTLSRGECRDLLKDNTSWDSEFVAACVEHLRGPDQEAFAPEELAVIYDAAMLDEEESDE